MNFANTILVTDDMPEALMATAGVLRAGGYEVIEARSGKECLEAIKNYLPDLVLLDVVLPDIEGTEVCRQIKTNPEYDGVFVILISSSRISSDSQVNGLEGGADGYILRPIASRELLARVLSLFRIKWVNATLRKANDELEQRVRERTEELVQANNLLAIESEERMKALKEIQYLKDRLQEENVYLRQEVHSIQWHGQIVGQSPSILQALKQISQVAPTNSTVLLLGETGTGKELFASAIHELSPRKNHPMIRVNCAAIPVTLIESELFGREKGAYTGALSRAIGRFEMADGSTLFLDEIGDLPIETQLKLLRVLQEKTIERLGSSKSISVDVRIITATNHDLTRLIKEGRFREDLYYRLNVFPVIIPPLRERREDIPLLVWKFIDEFSRIMGKNIESVSEGSMKFLKAYDWPGNIRELKNMVERAMIVSTGPRLNIDISGFIGENQVRSSLKMTDMERQHIRQVLDLTGWRIRGKGGAAELLDINPTTLESRMARLGIQRPGAKTRRSGVTD